MLKPWQLLSEADSEVYSLIEEELLRQRQGIELIASENFASPEVIASMGNILNNKYAEGQPGKRYYGGCEVVDRLENLAIARVCQLFGSRFANVQPHSGAQANAAVLQALLEPQDVLLGMDLTHGGHLTHGSKVNFSGLLYQAHSYGVHSKTHLIDYDLVHEKAQSLKPRVIIAGASAYPRAIDFKKFREIADEVGAYLFVDMAHIAGLVACGLHENPVPYAHVVTSTTHKTLRGPRGGIILWNDESLTAKLNKAVFPGTQGGPLEHIIAAKAVCFKEALSPAFSSYQKKVRENAQSLAQALLKHGFNLVSNGTDNHLVLIDLSQTDVSGKALEEALERRAITTNKNTVPQEKRSPFVTSGVRLGVPAVTSRGMGTVEMQQIARIIFETFSNMSDEALEKRHRAEVSKIAAQFPLYLQW